LENSSNPNLNSSVCFAFNTQTIAQVKQTKVEQKTNVIVAEINENNTDASLEKKI